MANKTNPTRGELWTITKDAYIRLGIPVKERRPWLIVQDNKFKAFGSRVACALTSACRKDPTGKWTGEVKEQRDTQVLIAFIEPSYVSCDDIYTIKSGEFVKRVGDMSDKMEEVDAVLRLTLALR